MARPTLVRRAVHSAESAGGPVTAVHPLLAARFSPHRFDATRTVDEQSITALAEAFRWAPSAGNSQPWGLHCSPLPQWPGRWRK
ncbi:nitroreductase family protein [Actinocrinis sp.]|uniref:nitroreductase family protein n=1 Tax=Actinocrinis sp. TaxID=1920516 RepID=UPI0039C8A10D